MSPRRVPFYGDRIKPLEDLASLPEPEPKPNPIESLGSASEETLQNLMLSRMATAANLRRDIANLISQMAEQLGDAKLAEMLLAQKRKRENGQ
jgi:hypothetical protein